MSVLHEPTFREYLERYRDEIVVFKRAKEIENKLVKYILTEPFCTNN